MVNINNAPINTIYENNLIDGIGFLPPSIVYIYFNDNSNTYSISMDFERFYKLAREGVIKVIYEDNYGIGNQGIGFVFYAEDNIIKVHILYYCMKDKYYQDDLSIIELTISKNGCNQTNSTGYIKFVRYYEIDTIINNILKNKEIEISDFDNIVTYSKYGKAKVYSYIHGDITCNIVGNDKIILQWNDETNIHHCVINRDMTYVHNTIQINDQTLYRLSNLTIDPIVNPKIWVGTITQYAAIAQKDNNTTYIVKSDA